MNKLLAMGMLSLIIIGITQYFDNSELNLQQRFEIYTRKYGKFYGPSEKIFRTKIYEERIKLFEAHNSDKTQTYTMGENQFTDLTQEEFESIYLRRRSYQKQQFENYVSTSETNLSSANWEGLTAIKDQGQCGAGWAFAAIGAVESILRIDGITDKDLSEQQLIDCDLESQGCEDGNLDNALNWVLNNGVTTATNYPYTGKTEACKRQTGLFQIKGYQKVDPNQMQPAIIKSPIAASVDGSSWIFYKSGVFNRCSFEEFNHDVLIIGFKDDGTWIVKNSWGQWWGENGIIRLPKGNSCGIQEQSFIAYA
ncbi:unnamed protein product [Paramecium pentaurelia]|uniref:cathepsin L n=1 Tax=Paramecium pentaurelia TaxID=43138 RepID=A0A8S1VMK4_9CILI|nr:unnamed protein product [Paramecium pentaurelia]